MKDFKKPKDLRRDFAEGKLANVNPMESVVRRYLAVKDQLEALEIEKKRLNDEIKMHLAHTGVKETQIAEFSITISDCVRSGFSLISAADTLTSKEYAEYVSPFVKETAYTQLRIKRLAGK